MAKYELQERVRLTDSGPPPNANFFASNRKFKFVGDPNGNVLGLLGDECLDPVTGDTWDKVSPTDEPLQETKYGWQLDDDSNSAVISTGSVAARTLEDRFAETINVLDYIEDLDEHVPGETDDSAAIILAASKLQNGGTLLLPLRHMMRMPAPAIGVEAVGIELVGLEDITIRGTIVNDEFGLDDADIWKSISTMTAVGTTVTVTTAQAHGLSIGGIVQIYTDSDKAYNGAVTVATTPTSTSFTYVTLGSGFVGGTPVVSPATGIKKWANPDFQRYLFRFTRCKNVTIDVRFDGSEVPRSSRHRLGYQLFDFQQAGGIDNTFKSIFVTASGCQSAVSAGSFQSTAIGHVTGGSVFVRAENVGYPIAAWGRAFQGSFIDITADDTHRVAYFAGPKGITLRARGKNYDNSGPVGTPHYVSGSESYYPEANDWFFTDTGTTENNSWADQWSRFAIGFDGQDGGATSGTYRNNRLGVDLKVSNTIGKNIVACRFYHHASNPCFVDGLIFHGSVNRAAVSSLTGFQADSNDEIFFRLNGAGQVLKNASLQNFVVQNSATITGAATLDQVKFKRDIQVATNPSPGIFRFFNSTTTSYQADTVVIAGAYQDYDNPLVLRTGLGSTTVPSLSGPDLTTGFAFPVAGVMRLPISGVLAYTFSATAFFPSGTKDSGSDANPWQFVYASGVIKNPFALSYGASTVVDLTSIPDLSTLQLAGGTTFSTANRRAGRKVEIRILADASTDSLAFPVGWRWISAKPTEIAANKLAIIKLWSFGTTDADIVAKYDVES